MFPSAFSFSATCTPRQHWLLLAPGERNELEHPSKMLLRYGGRPRCWSNRKQASAISSNWRTRASASSSWKNITPIDVATAKSTMFGACIDMESLGGSCHNGWESKNFPLMQKGNLRNKFKWFPFCHHAKYNMLCNKTSLQETNKKT